MPCAPRFPGRSGRARRGVTLLELIVVLLLVGLATALVAPALARPAVGSDPTIGRILDGARATAVRRGETLALDVAADGRWALVVAHADSLPLAGGVAALDAAVPRRLLVTPLGLCLPDDAETATGASWDAAACRAFDAPAAR